MVLLYEVKRKYPNVYKKVTIDCKTFNKENQTHYSLESYFNAVLLSVLSYYCFKEFKISKPNNEVNNGSSR